MLDIILDNGTIIDPHQKLHLIGSVGIDNGKIAFIGDNVEHCLAKSKYNCEGKFIVPGLIDLHCHPALDFAESGVSEKEIGLDNGVTLLCDAGTAGASNFVAMRKFVIENAETEILCFLNLAHSGLIRMPEITSRDDIDYDTSLEIIRQNKDVIKGIKVRGVQSFFECMGTKGVEIAKRLANETSLPLMMHIGETRKREINDKMDSYTREAVSLLEQGDIISHYLTWEPGGLIDENGTIGLELINARNRGVYLDACHGRNHFSFDIAKHAISQGLAPDILSTDLCKIVIPSAQSLAVTMSKFLALGLELSDVIKMTTATPAVAIDEIENRGTLTKGKKSIITVFEIVKGKYFFNDGNGGHIIESDKLIEPRMTVIGNKFYPAYSRYHIPADFKPV